MQLIDIHAVTIRPVDPISDAQAIADIYNPYITDTCITYEEEALSCDAMATRIGTISSRFPYLVAIYNGTLIGYAYADTFRERAAYRRAVEISVYVAEQAQRQGVARLLYSRLFDELRARAFVVAYAYIDYPNPASEALHTEFGFERVGVYKDCAYKFDTWRSVLCLEKRVGEG